MSNVSKLAQDTAIAYLQYLFCTVLTMGDWEEVVYDLSNGAIFNDLEWHLTKISRRGIFDIEYLRNDIK